MKTDSFPENDFDHPLAASFSILGLMGKIGRILLSRSAASKNNENIFVKSLSGREKAKMFRYPSGFGALSLKNITKSQGMNCI